MDWTRSIDGYCERLGPEYWAEPVNAVTNAAFLITAVVMWRRTRGAGLPLATALVGILAGIGVGSFLFHTHAQVWAAFADSGAIAVFALVYVFAANRDFWGLKGWRAWAATGLFIPYVVLTVPIFARLPFFEISSGYWPLPILVLVYGLGLRRRAPETGQGLLIAAGICAVSLTARSLDEPLCAAIPIGTHFLWHVLNGVLLGWMIEVYLRHMRGPLAATLRGG
ncbi:ceramidase domain-containing protein [Meridianimarinicoccus zhengii]|uniref:ceramidase domain-containing protein n=1 Tax=Meridianimarinicoccus zhengii TaxID=2056810 RepID=UPI000DAE336A|nr:ceramidase domain-containing protein [Phycocomes zhengii]